MSGLREWSLDGEDWSLYWLHPHEREGQEIWRQDPPEAAERRVPAVVPGHAQTALLRAGTLPHPYQGLNGRAWEWTSERDWVYEKRFMPPTELSGPIYRLRFEGLDDSAQVFLNGRRLGEHSGQFVPVEWDVTDVLRPGEENLLLVVVRASGSYGQADRISPEQRWKSRFAHGNTRLDPIGIWDSVSLRSSGPAWFRDVTVHTNLSIDQTEATVSVVSNIESLGMFPATVRVEIVQSGLPVADVEDQLFIRPPDATMVQSTSIRRVQLWWPNGTGAQPLYEARLTLYDQSGQVLDQRGFEFGVRKIEAVPCEGAPEGALPYGISVNGRRVWIQGWNWMPLDYLYGDLSSARYERFLSLARAAGVNLLRVWGGGLLEKDAFYRLCDRYGILVWQEFPLIGSGPNSAPPEDPAYLDYIREQAEQMLPRRRNHPSLALWCGGSELTTEGRPLDDEHPALAELRETVSLDDPLRLWLPTSPSGPYSQADPAHAGELRDVHGPWRWLGLREHPEFHNRIDPMLHSAFGCEGVANRATLEFIFQGVPSLPSTKDPVWMEHGGLQWLESDAVRAAFGELTELDPLIRASQRLQALGLQYAVEANRRRQWRCAGTLPWHLNEASPAAIGTAAVDYFGRPKPAYYSVARAYRAFHVSAAFSTFAWAGESEFKADVWLHNSGEERTLLNVVATVLDLEGRELYQENLAGEAPENSVENVGDLWWRFPDGFDQPFLLLLEVIDEEGDTLARNAYWHSRAAEAPFAGFLHALEAELEVERVAPGIRIRNVGAAVALGVTLEAPDTLVADSDFPLPPEGERLIPLADPSAPVIVRAWNAPQSAL